MKSPLLELEQAVLLEAGEPVLPPIDLVTTGDRVGLRERAGALLRALSGQLVLGGGTFLVSGVPLDEARAEGLVGVGCPLPGGGKSTVLENLVLAARLHGYDPRGAANVAAQTVAELGLEKWATRRLGRGCGIDHYLAGLVHAHLLRSPVVALAWPLGSFRAEIWARYGSILARVLADKRWVVSLERPARLDVEHAWENTLDEIVSASEMGLHPIPLDQGRVRHLLTVRGPSLSHQALAADFSHLELPASALPSRLAPAPLTESAWLVDCPRDPTGIPNTEALLQACERRQLVITHLSPLDGARPPGKAPRAMTPCRENLP
jgi:hypothetical protein